MDCIQFTLQTDRHPDKQSIYGLYTVYITNRQIPRQAKYIWVVYSLHYKQTETQTSKVYIESFIQSILQTDHQILGSILTLLKKRLLCFIMVHFVRYKQKKSTRVSGLLRNFPLIFKKFYECFQGASQLNLFFKI